MVRALVHYDIESEKLDEFRNKLTSVSDFSITMQTNSVYSIEYDEKTYNHEAILKAIRDVVDDFELNKKSIVYIEIAVTEGSHHTPTITQHRIH